MVQVLPAHFNDSQTYLFTSWAVCIFGRGEAPISRKKNVYLFTLIKSLEKMRSIIILPLWLFFYYLQKSATLTLLSLKKKTKKKEINRGSKPCKVKSEWHE
jgi:hypothetical protein